MTEAKRTTDVVCVPGWGADFGISRQEENDAFIVEVEALRMNHKDMASPKTVFRYSNLKHGDALRWAQKWVRALLVADHAFWKLHTQTDEYAGWDS